MASSQHAAPLALGFLVAALPAQGEKPGLDPAMMRIAVAYAAKVAASAVFVSGRSIDSVMAEEFAPDTALDKMLRPFLKFEVDRERRTVTASLPFVKATAVATAGLGCVLVLGGADADALRRRATPPPAGSGDPAEIDWPLGERVPPLGDDAGVDVAALERALDDAFAEPAIGPPRRTRAIVVAYRGRIVAERYRDGYTPQTLLPGWSMTKTLVDALVGIRVRQGELELDAPLRVPEWPAGDPRRALRLPDLLAMSSGLSWHESYDDPASDVLRMLFATADHAAVQADEPLAHAPGERFAYSSGTTNLICRELRATFDSDAEYWAFPRDELFLPLGIRRALVEADPSGTFVGSSYGFATARDWTRIGMLYAQDGVFAGRRILPPGWAARAAEPVPASDGRYGSHVWLNADPDADGPRRPRWPELPADLLRLDGHEGQYVFVLPGRQLVVTRLGCTKRGDSGVRALVRDVLAALAP